MTLLNRRLDAVRFASIAIGLVSLLLGACGLLGGGSSDPMQALREQIKSTVTDERRTEAMLETVETIDQLLIESAAVMRDAALRERTLFLDYDSTRQDYDDSFSDARRKRMQLQRALLDAHIEFKSHSSAEEWQILSSAQAIAVSTRIEQLLAAALERG